MNQSQTVLLIDDEEIIRISFSGFLTHGGYAVLEARDGEEGWCLFRQHVDQIDLIITDCNLPGMGGEELCAQARILNPSVKAILVTGDEREKDALEDAQAILQKPVLMAILLQTVRTVLDMK